MTNKILQRVEEGKCPICAKAIDFKLITEGAQASNVRLVKYSETSVIICSTHPCPDSIRCSSGEYEVNLYAQKRKK